MRWDGWRARDVGTEIGGGVVSNSQNRWEKVSSEKNCCYSSVEWSESIFSSERDFRSGDIIHLGVYRFSTFRTKCFVRRQEYNSKKTSRRKLFMRNRWVRVPQRISRIWPLIGQKHRLVIGPKRICAVKCKWIRVTRQNLTGIRYNFLGTFNPPGSLSGTPTEARTFSIRPKLN